MENTNIKRKEKFSLFQILRKGLLFLIVFTLLIGGAGTTISYFACKTTYTKRCEILLNVYFDEGALSSYENTSLAKQYMATVAGVIKSPINVESAKGINGEDAYDDGINRSAISVNYSYSSLIFSVSYSDEDPELAEKRLSAVLLSAQKLFAENSYIAAKQVRLIETQNTYATSSSNSFYLMSTLSFLVGGVLGLGIIFLRHALDNKIRTSEELEELIGIEVLATIKK
jgi:capsular polysaccharide biosynthesis protein